MTVSGVYPFSTQDGKSIPVDITAPVALTTSNFLAGTSEALTIPAGYEVAWLYATQDCVLKIGGAAIPGTLVEGVSYEKAMFIPSFTILTALLAPGSASITGVGGAGTLYINAMEQWAALAHQRQLAIG